ncbi:hypothetical protein C8046_17030 [Serinibacter arcticus]|uniref:Acyl-CoA carboxylase epsilon subunit n=1 Tax=Serinibacter arcticus TaxID=1655435 RepID=A0A2U1ZYN3_9MICO|nr:acyl-CoA carboxylase epsilon subunit [Serinibacter arcticus]PWD52096.1 hypothetical protein C8046_17030 [Serinibacter arcticus]
MTGDGGVDLGGATGADAPDASERTRIGELYGEVPEAPAAQVAGPAGGASGADDRVVLAPATVRVVRGEPDADELAALIAGLTAAAAASHGEEPAEVVRHRWMDRSHALRGGERGLPSRGDAAWRWSLHP